MLESGMLAGSEAYGIVGSRRSLTRKVKERATLSPSESDRLARMVRLISRSEEALGDRERAHRWLRKPNRALGGRRPLDLLASDVGARTVEQMLGRIEHGVYSQLRLWRLTREPFQDLEAEGARRSGGR